MDNTCCHTEILIELLQEGEQFSLQPHSPAAFFVREQYDDQAGKECKAVRLDGSKAIVFIPHGRKVYKH